MHLNLLILKEKCRLIIILYHSIRNNQQKFFQIYFISKVEFVQRKMSYLWNIKKYEVHGKQINHIFVIFTLSSEYSSSK